MSARVVKDNWREVSIRLERNIGSGVQDVGRAVERQIVGNITSEGLVDTGNYRRSWTTSVSGDRMEAQIGSPVEYGPYLEYGTRFSRARAHVVPAAKSVASRVAEHFRNLDR